jgi:hypothetical protein
MCEPYASAIASGPDLSATWPGPATLVTLGTPSQPGCRQDSVPTRPGERRRSAECGTSCLLIPRGREYWRNGCRPGDGLTGCGAASAGVTGIPAAPTWQQRPARVDTAVADRPGDLAEAGVAGKPAVRPCQPASLAAAGIPLPCAGCWPRGRAGVAAGRGPTGRRGGPCHRIDVGLGSVFRSPVLSGGLPGVARTGAAFARTSSWPTGAWPVAVIPALPGDQPGNPGQICDVSPLAFIVTATAGGDRDDGRNR